MHTMKSSQRYSQPAFYLYTIAAFLFAMLPLLEAAPIVARDPSDTTTITFFGQAATVQTIVLSVILFISGAYLCFLGGVHQHFTMFIVGFYVGANVAYIILSNAKETYGSESTTQTVLLVVSVVVGILAGLLLSCCFFLAVYLCGGLAGFFLALWILSWTTNGVIQSNWGRAILIIVLVVVGIVLMIFFERPLMVIATAFIGSFAIFLGIDIYVQTGFAHAVTDFLHARTSTVIADATPQLRAMLGGCLGLAIVGGLIQWCQLRRHKNSQAWTDRYPRGRYGWRRV
ncbi:hypothetical protein BC940DRAFT_300037 [Gongronella butleri]|nr:hypothetical protein BC940DRAFT_300037 [Gongronella butleri]